MASIGLQRSFAKDQATPASPRKNVCLEKARRGRLIRPLGADLRPVATLPVNASGGDTFQARGAGALRFVPERLTCGNVARILPSTPGAPATGCAGAVAAQARNLAARQARPART
jgi:hypothetical protein